VKIAVVNLTGGGLSGGYRKYLDEVVPRLRRHVAVEWVENFLPATVAQDGHRAFRPRDTWFGYRGLRRQIDQLAPDVVFIPTQRWFRSGIPTVVMVHNMEALQVPFGGNAIREALKNLVRARVALHACKHADRVIAVSRHVRDFLVNHGKIDQRKIGIVCHGVDEVRAPSRPNALALLQAPFLFTAGSIRPARGLEDLVAALPMISDATLVIAGRVDRGAEPYAAKLDALARKLSVSDRLKRTGHLDAAEMAWCYGNADAFVMTSRAEACPNIGLEAMAHGALIVSGQNAPMPEFFRHAARYYDLRDARSLAAAVNETLALPDAEKRARRDAARAISREFDWDKTAEQVVAQLREAMR
jgi:glycosyltransferase involved in cell wall biosynthesis